MKPGKGQKGSIPHVAWWQPESFRCQLLEEVLASGNLLSPQWLYLGQGFSDQHWALPLIACRDSTCPAMEYLLLSGTRQTSQFVTPPTHSRRDGHLTVPTVHTPVCLCAQTSIWKWDTGCVTTCAAAGGTATGWLFLIKPVGPVPPPSSSLDDSKKNEANPNNV